MPVNIICKVSNSIAAKPWVAGNTTWFKGKLVPWSRSFLTARNRPKKLKKTRQQTGPDGKEERKSLSPDLIEGKRKPKPGLGAES